MCGYFPVPADASRENLPIRTAVTQAPQPPQGLAEPSLIKCVFPVPIPSDEALGSTGAGGLMHVASVVSHMNSFLDPGREAREPNNMAPREFPTTKI